MNISDLRIPIESIPSEGLDLPVSLSPEVLTPLVTVEGQEPPVIISPLEGELKLRLSGNRLLLKGFFEVEVEIPCDRCLADSRTRLNGKIDEVLELISPGENVGDDDEGDGALEVIDGKVNLSGLLSEFFWLAWPFRFTCGEDCVGLCSRCGADLNQGPCGCRERDWN